MAAWDLGCQSSDNQTFAHNKPGRTGFHFRELNIPQRLPKSWAGGLQPPCVPCQQLCLCLLHQQKPSPAPRSPTVAAAGHRGAWSQRWAPCSPRPGRANTWWRRPRDVVAAHRMEAQMAALLSLHVGESAPSAGLPHTRRSFHPGCLVLEGDPTSAAPACPGLSCLFWL